MKTRILPVLLALLMVFSLMFAASADATKHETVPCDHDHSTLTEAHEHVHEHKEPAPVEKVSLPEETETHEPTEVPEETEESDGSDACPHENTWDGWCWKDDPAYTDTGDNSVHEVTGIRVTFTYCDDCNTVIAEQEEDDTDTEAHSFDESGVCIFCGHANSCAHENTWDGRYWKECTYTDTGDNLAHEVTGICVSFTYCDDCGTYITEQEEEYTDTEAHCFDENGVCVFCGHVNACPHENTWDGWYWKECTYTDTGDNTVHEVTGIRVSFTYCDDCGTYIAEQEEEYTDTEAHSFDENGVCIFCGHANSCAHENTWDGWHWKDDPAYTDTGDNLVHEVTGIRVICTYCDDCNSFVMEREEAFSGTEEHCYDENGVCKECGHINSCTHKNTHDNWYWIDCTYTDTGSEVTHEINGTRLIYTYCEDCESVFDDREQEFSEVERHMYVDGVCMYCGHVNSCSHEKTYICQAETDIDCTFVDTGDNRTHQKRCMHVCEETCIYCNCVLSVKEEMFTETRLHTYNENGICEECGHVCPHENTVEIYRWDPDTVTYPDHGSNIFHGISGVREWYSVCRDCGKAVFEREESFTSGSLLDFSNETHSYNENGVCEKCGHVNTCTHENVLDSWARKENEITYTDLGNGKHEVSGIRVWQRYCRDCNTVIKEWRDSFTKIEKHVYWGEGICEKCGHVCPHENISDHYEWNEDAVFTDTGDNLTHEASGTRYHGLFCRDCKAGWGWQETYAGPEAHDYDENGMCTQCGHIRSVSITVPAVKGGSAHGAGTYEIGETVTLIAKADKGYVSGGWTENGKIVSKGDTYTFTAEADRTLTPVFIPKGSRFDPIVKPIIPRNSRAIVR